MTVQGCNSGWGWENENCGTFTAGGAASPYIHSSDLGLFSHSDVFGIITNNIWRVVLDNVIGIFDSVIRIVLTVLFIKWCFLEWAACSLKRRLFKSGENRAQLPQVQLPQVQLPQVQLHQVQVAQQSTPTGLMTNSVQASAPPITMIYPSLPEDNAV